MIDSIALLRELTEADGAPAFEKPVRDIIEGHLDKININGEKQIDGQGNLIWTEKNPPKAKPQA